MINKDYLWNLLFWNVERPLLDRGELSTQYLILKANNDTDIWKRESYNFNRGFGLMSVSDEDEPTYTPEDILQMALKKIEEVKASWGFDIRYWIYEDWYTIEYFRLKTEEEYIEEKENEVNSAVMNRSAQWPNYIWRVLNCNHETNIRYIYIKLWLEWKITEEDIKLLADSRNTDIDLRPFFFDENWNPTYNTDNTERILDNVYFIN